MQSRHPLYEAYLATTNDPNPMAENVFLFHYHRRTKNIKDLNELNTQKKERAERRHDEVVKKQIAKKLKAHHKKLARQKERDAINIQRIKKGLSPIMFSLDEINNADIATQRYYALAELAMKD